MPLQIGQIAPNTSLAPPRYLPSTPAATHDLPLPDQNRFALVHTPRLPLAAAGIGLAHAAFSARHRSKQPSVPQGPERRLPAARSRRLRRLRSAADGLLVEGAA